MNITNISSNYFYLLLIEALTVISIFFGMALAARYLPASEYSELLVLRRNAALLLPFILLGTATTLVRELTSRISSHNYFELQSAEILSGAIQLCLFALIVFLIFFSIDQLILTNSLLGFSIISSNISLTIIWTIILCFHTFTFSIYRAMGAYKLASLNNLFTIAFSTLISGLFAGSFKEFIILNSGISFVCFFYFAKKIHSKYPMRLSIFSKNRATVYLLKNGFHRFLADLLFNFFLWLPIFWITLSSNANLIQAGSWAFSIMILTMFTSAVMPISMMALPEAKKLKDSKQLPFAIIIMNKALIGVVFFSSLVFILYNLIGETIFTYFFGEIILQYSSELDYIFLCLPGFLIYSVARSFNDAVYKAPVNLVTLIFSLTICIVVYALVLPEAMLSSDRIGFAMIASISCLGMLSWILVLISKSNQLM